MSSAIRILRLFGPTGSPLAVNDNWQDTQQPRDRSDRHPPQDFRESAIIATLPPAAYTATLADITGATGVGLVEFYDLNSGAIARLGNIATRGSVQTGGKRDDRGLCPRRGQHQSRKDRGPRARTVARAVLGSPIRSAIPRSNCSTATDKVSPSMTTGRTIRARPPNCRRSTSPLQTRLSPPS